MQETWVQPLDWEDPLEKGIATHSNILARRIPWTEEPGGLQSMGLQSLTQLSNTATTIHNYLLELKYLRYGLFSLIIRPTFNWEVSFPFSSVR